MRYKQLLHSKHNIWIVIIIATVTTFIQSLMQFRMDQSIPLIIFGVTWIIVNIAAFIIALWNLFYHLFSRKQLREKREVN